MYDRLICFHVIQKASFMVSYCTHLPKAFQMLWLSTSKILATPLLLPLDELDVSIHAISLATINSNFLGLVKCCRNPT